jgi:hypothetical protein
MSDDLILRGNQVDRLNEISDSLGISVIETQAKEIDTLKELEQNEYYLSGYNLEDQIVHFKNKFIAKGYFVIKTILNELTLADVSESQKLILLNLAIQIIRSDNVITLDELNFIKHSHNFILL